jgi:hypothetical protein
VFFILFLFWCGSTAETTSSMRPTVAYWPEMYASRFAACKRSILQLLKESAQTLLMVMRRGSLRAAEEITGHLYETIGEWLRRASEHAQALTAILTQGLHLSTVEINFRFIDHRLSSMISIMSYKEEFMLY